MGDPETKAKHSFNRKRNTISDKRKRNFIAKRMLEEKEEKTHMSKKDREKQRKWRLESDPDGDYESVDDFLYKYKET